MNNTSRNLEKSYTQVSSETQPRLVVMLTTGAEDGGKRATLAFSAACSAVSMDAKTKVFLIGDGAHWGYADRTDHIHQNGFPPLEELISAFQDLGGEVLLCSACDQVCSIPGDGESHATVRRDGIRAAGLASVLSDIYGGSSVTF